MIPEAELDDGWASRIYERQCPFYAVPFGIGAAPVDWCTCNSTQAVALKSRHPFRIDDGTAQGDQEFEFGVEGH